jgi:hypothetical protein
VFIHVAEDGLIMAPGRNNREQSAIVGLDPTTCTLGVNLGADYCAEHEWGIKRLQEVFGVKNEIGTYGLKKRKITKVPKSLVWVKLLDGRQGFAYRSYWFRSAEVSLIDDSDLKSYEIFDRDTHKMKPNPVQLAAAWSEEDFACLSKDPTDIKYLREIFEQFKKKNIIFTFSNALPAFDKCSTILVENPGLIIAIANRMPKEAVEMLTKADKENHEIEKFVAKSRIRELLKEKGKGYFALSPKRWEDGSIKFWLNPYDQNKVNYGYFTLEEVRLWADDKGPIPMSPAQVIDYHERMSGKKKVTAIQ